MSRTQTVRVAITLIREMFPHFYHSPLNPLQYPSHNPSLPPVLCILFSLRPQLRILTGAHSYRFCLGAKFADGGRPITAHAGFGAFNYFLVHLK